MIKMNKTLLKKLMKGLLLVVVGLLLLTGCQKKDEPSTINVFAAVGLQDVLEELKTVYIKEHPTVAIQYNFGSAGSLQQQIEQGAAADIFIPASPKHMEKLISEDLVLTDTKVNLLKNKVVLIVPSDNNAITSFEDLTKKSVTKIGIGDPTSVPVGVYAMEVLNYYNLFEKIESKLVNGKDVREVLSWVETKNAEAGVVYETEANIAEGVKVVATAPEDSHKPVTFPAAVLKDAQNQQGAKDFLNYLKGDEAKAKFEKFGFTKI